MWWMDFSNFGNDVIEKDSCPFCKKVWQIIWIQKFSQATVRDEIWFMTRVDVVAADGTVAIYFQHFYNFKRRMYSCPLINFSD